MIWWIYFLNLRVSDSLIFSIYIFIWFNLLIYELFMFFPLSIYVFRWFNFLIYEFYVLFSPFIFFSPVKYVR